MPGLFDQAVHRMILRRFLVYDIMCNILLSIHRHIFNLVMCEGSNTFRYIAVGTSSRNKKRAIKVYLDRASTLHSQFRVR